jgi:hypothetical protein
LTFAQLYCIIILETEREVNQMDNKIEIRKMKAKLHRTLVDMIMKEKYSDKEMNELWEYVKELAEKEIV